MLSFSIHSFVLYMSCLFTKGSLWILTSAAMFVYIHTKWRWSGGLSKPPNGQKEKFHGFDWFWGRGEKKLLLEQENLDSMFMSISTWSPASILNLRTWILKMRAQQAKNFEILNTCISKWENGGRMNWPPLSNVPPEIKNILISPKPPKFQP